MKLTGAEILMETLIEQGVDVVFGYPGGAALFVYDALYQYQSKLRHVLTSHEQGAAHAADGYARSTGKTGVVFATSGPGATNLITGIATAYMDSVPLVAVTSNVALSIIGRDGFQEVDICGISMPITKHNFMIKDAEKIAETVREAFTIANSGRQGPVLIDIPKDITAQRVEYVPAGRFKIREQPKPSDSEIEAAARLMASAQKPVILAGGGVVSANASRELKALADHIDAPVCLTAMGITAMRSDDSKNLSLSGMHGSPAANWALNRSDLILAVGTRFADRVTGDVKRFAPRAKIIHIDIDPSEHSKNVCVEQSIQGDSKTTLAMLLDALPGLKHTEWLERLDEYKKRLPMPRPKASDAMTMQHVVTEVGRLAGEDAIIVTDVGQHQMITAQLYPFMRPRSFISSLGLGTMGYGMGAAIGAKIANPDSPVVLITGDGSFHMNMNEMACAVSEKLGIIVLIMNNRVLGMVRQWQRLFYQGRYSNTSINRATDFIMLARAFGAEGFAVNETSEIAPAFKRALASQGPCIIDCKIDKDNSVTPIIPPNGAVDDTIFCE